MTENTLAETLDAKSELIHRMFAAGTSSDEFTIMLELAKRYQLDPFAKQIWAVKYGRSPAQIFVGRDGLLAIAHRNGNFDGMESGIGTDAAGEIYAWAKVYRKDMSHPFEDTVWMKEYNSGNNLWISKPKTMLQKVAEAHCLRKAFSLSGFYTPYEFGDAVTLGTPNYMTIEYTTPAPAVQPPAEPPKAKPANCITEYQVSKIRALYADNGWDTAVIDAARHGADCYDKDMIDADYKLKLHGGLNAQTASEKPAADATCQWCGTAISSAELNASLEKTGYRLCSHCLAAGYNKLLDKGTKPPIDG